MSDIRYNNWFHRSGTGGVHQASNGRVGIGSTIPQSTLDLNSGEITCGEITGGTGNFTGIVTSGQFVVGNTFLKENQVGFGETTTPGRDAGIGTAVGTVIYNSSLSEVQVYKGDSLGWTNISDTFIQATGGTVSEYTEGTSVYKSHIFNSTGTFTVTKAAATATVEALVVAGGGGGGHFNSNGAGGGGAGGLLEGSFPVSSGAYTISVGAGGGVSGPGGGDGRNGANTTIASPSMPTITANGGGGGSGGNRAGLAGGSGGGAGGNNLTNAPATQTPYSPTLLAFANQGGTASPGGHAGGGGGAGGAGVNGTVTPLDPPRSGPGRSNSFTGTSVTYAVGGGVGPFSPGVNMDDAAINTGNGGDSKGNPGYAGAGGSGIVVIRYQIGSLGGTAKATGGNVSFANGKTIHTFLSTGTFAITDAGLTSVDYLVVAGGGAGSTGTNGGGGGGAGGFRTGTGLPVSNASPYTVTVGAGGERSIGRGLGTSGNDSTFSTITSTGGGRGGGTSSDDANGADGGSGGGGAYNGSGGAASPVTSPVQGYAGGTGATQAGLPGPADQGAGGGGASGAGQPGTGGSGAGGDGGNGLTYALTNTAYAGGGGGASNTTNTRSSGGTGGGGGGAGQNPPTNRLGTPGDSNTGGGGGAGNGGTAGGSGAGGSGIVIISYPT